jgi:putative CRISPR-associated protein (TIGR02620 family)
MAVYLIIRHFDPHEWTTQEAFITHELIAHLDAELVRTGNAGEIGTLTVNLAERICAHGERYWNLSLGLSFEKRGLELSAKDMPHYGARVEECQVEKIAC